MKRKLLLFLLLMTAFTEVIILNSCQKELSCDNCPDTNQPPVAKAGIDQIITLPTDSITLDGSASDDPDGTITTFLWTKISGPASFTIINPDLAITKIKNLILAVYIFELKVTDNAGLTAKDTISVIVNISGTINQPPVAKAGADQTINLPNNTVTLDGNGSTDSDGTIVLYSWNQIAGPNQSIITSSSYVISSVNNLIQGIYQFELKVTDNGGLFAKDTVQIIVNDVSNSCAANRPVVNAQLVPIGTLSQARQDMVTATAGTKILFAGGSVAGNFISTRVDIYDFVANTWDTAELSTSRHAMAVATIGNKIFFAGGYDDYFGNCLTRVDIYDAAANTWSTAELSEGRAYTAAASLGDKVFFAGGFCWGNPDYFSNRVDIYNNTTNTWSTASLSEGREALSATQAGNKIYFAGGRNSTGVSNKIDIYDGASNSWSISSLSEGKWFLGSIAVANKIYWAGGVNALPNELSAQVEIRDINTQVSTLTCLSQAKQAFGTVLNGNEIVFFMGGPSRQPMNFDIYNTATESWSIGALNQGINYPGIISVNNKIYVAGGTLSSGGLSNQVWLLEW